MSTPRYELLDLLDDDGFAHVHHARLNGEQGLTKRVAVKVLHARHAAAHAGYLARQAELMSRVSHPDLVRVDELTQHDGLPALVMEYVHGVDLGELLRRRRELMLAEGLPLERVLHVVARVASALAATHDARGDMGQPLGLVHGLLRPRRVMISDGGAVKVLGFGAYQAFSARGELSTDSTPYASPEARAGATGPEDDVYALGVLLYSLATGRRAPTLPVEQGAHDAMAATLSERLSTGAPPPPDVPQLLREMLSWDPLRRPSAAEVMERCEDALSALSPEPFRPWARALVAHMCPELRPISSLTPLPRGMLSAAVPDSNRPARPERSTRSERARRRELRTMAAIALVTCGVTVSIGFGVLSLRGPEEASPARVEEPAVDATTRTPTVGSPEQTQRTGVGGQAKSQDDLGPEGGPPTPPSLPHPSIAPVQTTEERPPVDTAEPDEEAAPAEPTPAYDPTRAGPPVTRGEFGLWLATRPQLWREEVLPKGEVDDTYLVDFDGPTPAAGTEHEPMIGAPATLAAAYCSGLGGLPYFDATPLEWSNKDRPAHELRLDPQVREGGKYRLLWRIFDGTSLPVNLTQTDTFSGWACAAPWEEPTESSLVDGA